MRISTLALLAVAVVEPAFGFVAPGGGGSLRSSMTTMVGSTTAQSAVPAPPEPEPIVEPAAPSGNVLELGSMSAPTLREKTSLLLDLEKYPPGTLPESALTGSMIVLNAWARTACLTGAATATSILERLEQEAKAGNKALKLSVMHYSVVAHAWAKSDNHQAGVQAEKVLDKMIARAEEDPTLTANRIVFNCIIHAWSRQGNTERAEATFERMKADPAIQVETGDYNALLSTYARNGNARKAEGVLKDMLESGCEPDIISYNCILDSWRQGDEPGAAERAESILETLQSNFDKGESDIRPNGRSYSSVASAYIKSGQSDSVAQAERLLSVAEERGHAGDSYLYNSVLDAWAMSGQKDSAMKAEEILNDMEKAGTVNTVSYNTVIKAWKLSSSRDAASRAEALLNRMEVLSAQDYRLAVAPDVFTYTAVIQCYTKENQEGSAVKAVALLNRMIASCRAGNDGLKPNTITVNVVLDALAKAGDGKSAQKAEEILNMFQVSCESCLDKVSLNTVSYTSVIDAYAKCGTPDAAQKAEEIFAMMEKEFADGNRQVKPNTRSYNTLLNAWIQTGKRGSVQRAEIILKQMEEEYASGNLEVRPDVVSFSIVMNGWSKSGDPAALEMTSGVFQRMVMAYKAGNVAARPNLHSFVTLLYAIVNSGRPGAPVHAEKLLRGMYEDYKNGNVSAKPNTQAMTLVIDCWAKSGAQDAGEKAEALLDWMIGLYEEDKDEAFKPNQLTWNAAVNAWAKSRVFGKANRAKNVLDRMVAMYEMDGEEAKPNTFVYTAVVNAAAYTVGDTTEKRNAFKIATNTFKDLGDSNYGTPNHVTYGAYMTACRNLIPEGDSRASTVEGVFKKCCQDGMLNEMVLQRLESALTAEQFMGMIPDDISPNGGVDVASLPKEWRRNVRDKKPRTKKYSKQGIAKRP